MGRWPGAGDRCSAQLSGSHFGFHFSVSSAANKSGSPNPLPLVSAAKHSIELAARVRDDVGIPIIWTDVLQAYDTAAAADKAIAVFGALSFWWMGEHGHPRMDTSDQVYFGNDQLAVRFIEEIDFDYMATDATSALITAAS